MKRKLLSILTLLGFFGLFLVPLACSPPAKQSDEKAGNDGKTSTEKSATEKSKEPMAKDGGVETPVEKTTPEKSPEPQPKEAVSEGQPSEPVSEGPADAGPEASPETAPEATPEAAPETSPEGPPKNLEEYAAILNIDYIKKKSSISIFSVKSRKVVKEFTYLKQQGDLSSDMVIRIRANDRYLIVLVRSGFDPKPPHKVFILDIKNKFKVDAVMTLDPNSNPQDAEVVNGNTLYVSLYNQPKIKIFTKSGNQSEIDLSSLAEDSNKKCKADKDCSASKKCDTQTGYCKKDGLPELGEMFALGDKLYVAVQGLDRNNYYSPVKSYLAVIDTKTNSLSAKLSLFGKNPTGIFPDAFGNFLLVETGSYMSDKDGGVEKFDSKTQTLSGNFLIKEQDTGGSSIASLAALDDTKLFAIVNDKKFNQWLVELDMKTGKKVKDMIKASKLGGLAINSKGELYVGSNAKGQVGLRIFDAKTGQELTTTPISNSQNGYPIRQIIFFKTDPKNVQ